MNANTNMKIVAHIDILGMSVLVEKDFPKAWEMLSDLINVKDKARNQEYEFLETNESLRVFDHINMVIFSDTLLLFTTGDSDIELKSMIILVAEIFHKALFKCVPVRAGIALGEFWFNLDKSMYAGPALIKAYKVGEAAQWLGITLCESAQDRAIDLGMKSRGSNVIVNWPVPIKNGKQQCGFVVNWPAMFAHTLKLKPPISVNQFYMVFEPAFGGFDTLPMEVRSKYEHTVQFMNRQLELHPVSRKGFP